jgi:hypothetical protein
VITDIKDCSRLAWPNRLGTQQRHLDISTLKPINRQTTITHVTKPDSQFKENTPNIFHCGIGCKSLVNGVDLVQGCLESWYNYSSMIHEQEIYHIAMGPKIIQHQPRRDFRAIRPSSNLVSNLMWSLDHESLTRWLHRKSLTNFTLYRTTVSYNSAKT